MGAPARIGRYAVERELGRGGMGRVYLAHDPELERRIAIKVLPGRLRVRDLTITATHGRRFKYVPTASFFTLFNHQDPREQTIDGHTLIGAQYERV